MRLKPSILSWYIVRNWLAPFISGFLFFTFIILIFYLKDAIKYAVEKSMPSQTVLELLFYSLGWTITLTVPMAALMSTIITIGGMNADSEIIAMRAGGVKYSRILRPLLLIGVLLTAFQFYFQWTLNPYCMKKMRSIMEEIYDYDPIAILEPGVFTILDKTKENERHIYIERVERNHRKKKPDKIYNIQIRSLYPTDNYYRLRQLIIAKEGEKILKVYPDGRKQKALRLYKGYIFNQNKQQKSMQRIDFMKGYVDINIRDLREDKKEVPVSMPQALSRDKLEAEIEKHRNLKGEEAREKYLELVMEWNKRNAFPFASLVFVFLGFPVAIVNRRSGKGIGFGLSMIFIFLYYVVYLMSDSIAVQARILSPSISAWLANFLCFGLGLYVYVNRTNDIDWQRLLNKFLKRT
ncbi:MAG: YjgP/YjgQ family permease [Candidatus Hydrogenedentota bacterium]|nr:MAG: YjgP/YjgQ family permease [Candidatus Hydrogenedentota bacterium]